MSPLKIALKHPFLHLPADFWKCYAEKNPNMLYINRKKILRGFQKSKLEVAEMKSEKMISFLLFFEGVLTNFLPYAIYIHIPNLEPNPSTMSTCLHQCV